MSEKIFRFRLSASLDQDIIGFLEAVPSNRRSELLRHIIRYYISQLKDDGELFILTESSQDSQSEVDFPKPILEKEEKVYKVRFDAEIDHLLIETINRVPRKRRSEFWRHVLRYYMSQLSDDKEVFIMPTTVHQPNVKKSKTPIASGKNKPVKQLKGLSF